MPLDTYLPRTGSPLARRSVDSPVNRVQFADTVADERSRSPSIERTHSYPDVPSLSATMAARTGSPANPTSPPPQQGLPPHRRLSSRRASVALDPWGKHYAEDSRPRTSSSRLTIVRVPSTVDTSEDYPPPGASPGPFGGSGSFRERSHTRRSSWGANSGTSSDGEGEPGPGGRKRSRMSFAFSSFTPIAPVPVPARQGPPNPRAASPGSGPGFASSFGPAQGGAGRPRTRSTGGVDLSSHNPTQDRSGARPPQLSAQQLYDLAMASRDPAAPHATPPVPGVSASVEPAHFTALPQGEILPFLDRPKEVEALITTPGTQSQKLFTLLGALFPRPLPDDPPPADDGPTPKVESSQPRWPPLPGEENQSKGEQLALSPPALPQPPPSKAAPAEHPLGLPPNSTQWTYAQLVIHLTQTTREQLPDKEWVLFARACIRARSEALWERVKGCLGVPSDIYEDDETDEDDEEEEQGRHMGISELSELSPVVGFRRPHGDEPTSGSSQTGSDEEPEAWVEPVFPSSASGPGSARGSVSNSPTHYFAGGTAVVTGLGGGKSDSRSWGGSVSGRSDGPRMELIGEEEEEEDEEDDSGEDKDKADGKTPEPDSPMVGLRILTAPMSPTYHPAAPAAAVAPHSTSTSPGFVTPTGGTGTPVPVAQGIPIPGSSGPASPTQPSVPPSIDSMLGPPLPARRAGAWVSPLSNTISTGGRGLSGMGGRGGGGGWNSPVSTGGWNSPLSVGGGGARDAWNPVAERGPGNPLFPSSFARLSLGPTLSANNPSLRSPPPAPPSMYPHLRYLRERYKWARPNSENDFAITIASGSSDAGGSRRGGR